MPEVLSRVVAGRLYDQVEKRVGWTPLAIVMDAALGGYFVAVRDELTGFILPIRDLWTLIWIDQERAGKETHEN